MNGFSTRAVKSAIGGDPGGGPAEMQGRPILHTPLAQMNNSIAAQDTSQYIQTLVAHGQLQSPNQPLTTNLSGSTGVIGTLPVASGGSGTSSIASGAIVIGQGTAPVASITVGTNLQNSGGSLSVVNSPTFGNITVTTKATIGALTLTKSFTETPAPVADAATIAIDASAGSKFTTSSATDRAFSISNPTDGQDIVFRWKNTDTNPHTLTAPASVRFGSTFTAISATVAGKTDYLYLTFNGTDSKWDLVNYVKGF